MREEKSENFNWFIFSQSRLDVCQKKNERKCSLKLLIEKKLVQILFSVLFLFFSRVEKSRIERQVKTRNTIEAVNLI